MRFVYNLSLSQPIHKPIVIYSYRSSHPSNSCVLIHILRNQNGSTQAASDILIIQGGSIQNLQKSGCQMCKYCTKYCRLPRRCVIFKLRFGKRIKRIAKLKFILKNFIFGGYRIHFGFSLDNQRSLIIILLYNFL